MAPKIDLTGRVFGKLTVTGYAGRNGKNRVSHWKGVQPSGNKFCAKITCKRKIFLLGSFATAEEAARAYDAAAIEKFDQFARTNFEAR